MMLDTKDQLQVDGDAFNFAMQHRSGSTGLRRSDLVRAAEKSADRLPAIDDDVTRDARERATIHRFAGQVLKHLSMESYTFI